ncbi:MAG TPA: alpha/beta fold hydrolase [Candidatus Eisenbacteria bacterium]|nr:alpha/beta fold hydrolase [Candidatus Eisenbacteria bacterium]
MRLAAARSFARTLALAVTLLPGLPSSGLAAPFGTDVYQPHRESAIAGTPFTRYFTTDRLHREITFYLSDAPDSLGPLPLVVHIQGSGGNSNFAERDGRIVTQNGQGTLYGVCRDRARTLMVEKPGVRYLDPAAKPGERPGTVEFCREHTLERWTEAVEAAIRAARRIPGVRQDRLLVMGHSEGGIVACRVAREMGPLVTHVACLSGGGPTQLFDLIEHVRRGQLMGYSFGADDPDDPEARLKSFLALWDEVLADSMSAEKLFLGHPYRRWFTFLRSSPMQELTDVNARIYVAQGLDDASVDPESADVLFAELKAQGKDVTYDRVPGASHAYAIKDRPGENGWQKLLGRVVGWYLNDNRTSGGSR